MRTFIFRWKRMNAEVENEEESAEHKNQSEEESQPVPQLKLRDLRPEKDPIGAVNRPRGV